MDQIEEAEAHLIVEDLHPVWIEVDLLQEWEEADHHQAWVEEAHHQECKVAHHQDKGDHLQEWDVGNHHQDKEDHLLNKQETYLEVIH